MSMTKRNEYSFVLHSFLPELEERGMTIKTRNAGELTLASTDPDVVAFIQSMRRRLTNALSRPSLPPSPYGI
ncbi:hypothetical protein VR554_08280 [Escherichia coli]|uniref:hypothetical protein n=1 Tax=Escherichia coli TaxID=562 RepID=UPI002DBCF3D3|nr:hypothetical protein [Escherichia coli]MEC4297619.1 hypothetical protein [Escherichia coli]